MFGVLRKHRSEACGRRLCLVLRMLVCKLMHLAFYYHRAILILIEHKMDPMWQLRFVILQSSCDTYNPRAQNGSNVAVTICYFTIIV